MAKLFRRPQNELLLADLRIARSLPSRVRGLLGTSGLSDSEGLWIHRCNSIHTFFMRYSIDCVFLDRNLMVRSVVENIRPGRIVWPRWSARSVIELRAGRARELQLKPGDALHVGD